MTKGFLLAATALAAGALIAGQAPAQTTPAPTGPAPDAASQQEATGSTIAGGDTNRATTEPENQIVVTGSRIARTELSSASPIAVIGNDEIRRQGATNIASVIAQLPQAGIPGVNGANSNFLTSGNGVNTINLRNLGDQRTLVLVNGRRFVAGLAGTSTVDINNIPADFIDHFEVVTGGASAVYGSEAIAGVVNFVLKDSFQGITARAQYGITSYGDDRNYNASITGGTKFGADDRGSIIANFTYDRDYGLYSRDRPISAQDCSALGCGPQSYSTYAPQGRFQFYRAGAATANTGGFASNLFTFNPDNSLVTGFPTGYGYNRESVRRIIVPVQRYIGNAIAKYQVTDGIRAFVEGTYSHVKAGSRIENYALGSDLDLGFGYAIDNPFIPAAIQQQIAARNSDAIATNNVDQISFRRRLTDVFDRSNRNSRDTFRVAAGLDGDLGRFKWQASYVYGQLKDHTRSEDIDLSKFALGLDAVRDATGQIVCRSATARAAGCVPINLFGNNTVSQAARDYVRAQDREERVKNTEQVANVNITGPLFKLPGGDLRASVGGEYRREYSSDDWDDLTNAGLNTGNQIPDTVGRYNVKEVFGELDAPLLADKPFIKELGAQGAVRYSDYSTVGSVFSWNAGGRWSPIEGLRFRGQYAVANRAPNVGELFSPPAETFPAVNDPCNGVTATGGNATYAAACRATPAVAAGIARNGGINYTLADLQGINGFSGGNRNLKEEKSKTITAGVVVNPAQVRGLSLTVDYFDIKINDAIGIVDRQTSIQQCLLTGLPQFCGNVIRNPQTGLISTVNATLVNIASLRTRGLDTAIRYAHPVGLMADDRIDFYVLWTHTFHYKTQTDPSAPVNEGVGNLQYGKVFRDKVTGRVAYTFGPISASWQTTVLSGMKAYAPNEATAADLLAAGYAPEVAAHNDIKARVYHAVQLSANVGPDNRFQLFAGVNNLFNRKPPKLEDASFPDTVTVTGTTTAADVYDPIGRRIFAGVQVHY